MRSRCVDAGAVASVVRRVLLVPFHL